jgi:hypothetical protein
VTKDAISGTVTLVQSGENPVRDFDTFSYTTKSITLAQGVVVSL